MKIITLSGQIELLSGLHIGGGDDTMKIGGIDNAVIKNVNTNKPYIPGSSLKGKMRSLLEWNLGLVGLGDGKPFGSDTLEKIKNTHKDKEALIKNAENLIRIFGDSNANSKKTFQAGITRISVGDCSLNSEKNKNQELSEAKYENTINRKDGTASNPRQTERVPAGIIFDYDIRLKILDGDNEEEFKALLQQALELLENDYLGGSGSRGYGRIKFTNKSDWK